jgi:serine/threonine-protein kinase
VISQSPEAGKRVASGARVTLIVSGGPASAPVTDVEGLSEQEALKKLKKAGFKPRVTKQASATVASGKVIGTNPPAGTVEQLGSGVEVLVSSGPAPVTVPDVTGQSLAAAEATLANAELELGTVTKRESTEQQPGTVLSQSPSNGTSVKAKSKVDLVVAEASKNAAVPNVVGETQALAKSTIEQAGFKIATATGQTSEAAQVGKVLRQSPGPGTKATKGTTVTVTIAQLGPETTPTTTTTSTTPATPTPPAAGG